MSEPTPDQIHRLRDFSRRSARAFGLFDHGYRGSDLSLTEARTLYEIARGGARTASDLQRGLGLDRGHASRLLGRMERRGYLRRAASAEDARRRILALTDLGTATFETLNAEADRQAAGLLAGVPAAERAFVLQALADAGRLFAAPAPAAAPEVVLRQARAGDYGWIVERNGAVYTREFGWDQGIEAVACEVVGAMIRNFDPAMERCWIAERDGERVGCVALLNDGDSVARLRLLIVEPAARGLGLGERLIGACIAFARETGYREIVLWTHADLIAARKLYARAGFEMIEAVEEETFGKIGVNETWRMDL